ncbi:putative protein-tyrosine sulfotransferase [Helianthus annuus]|nr:putative protein-tyrosine sulfotransferase [Helianthus annuus]
MTVEKLMETYGTCVSKLRSSQSKRRINSFKRISPANFTKEARLHVSEAILKKITSLNALDVELYKHAQKIFARQYQVMELKLLDSDRPVSSLFCNHLVALKIVHLGRAGWLLGQV